MLKLLTIRNYCSQKEGSFEDFPFDETTLVFKVNGKMYALCSLEKSPLSINLKCDPDLAITLRGLSHEQTSLEHDYNRRINTRERSTRHD